MMMMMRWIYCVRDRVRGLVMQTLRLHNADRCSEEREGREEREGMNVWREEYIGTMGLKKKKKKET